MSRFRILFLALIVASLTLYVIKFEVGKDWSPKDSQGEAVFLLDRQKPIEQISYQVKDVSFVIKNNSNTWTLADPKGAPTDPEKINNVLDGIYGLEFYNSIREDELASNGETTDRPSFGLDSPELVIEVVQGGKQQQVKFGKPHQFSGRRYARRGNEQRVILVGEEEYQQIQTTKRDIREGKPIAFDAGAVDEIVAERRVGKVPKLRIYRAEKNETSEDPNWILEAGSEKFVAERKLVSTVLKSANNLVIKDFVDSLGQEEQYGLKDPTLSLTVHLNDALSSGSDSSKRLTILFGAVSEISPLNQTAGESGGKKQIRYYFKRSDSPWIYQLQAMLLTDLLQPPDHFRDRTPFNELDAAQIAQVRIRKASGEEFSLVKWEDLTDGTTRWERIMESTKESFPVEASVAEEIIKNFLDFEVLAYVEAERGVNFADESPSLIDIAMVVREPVSAYRLLVNEEIPVYQSDKPRNEETEPELKSPETPKETMLPTKSGGSPASPRYGGVQLGKSEIIPVLISSAAFGEITKDIKVLLEGK